MSDYNQEEYVLYKDREEWSDLKPVKQNDGPNPVVQIAYSPEFVDAYDYFRGVVAAGEMSKRALHLIEDCIEFNAANYTVWQYRRMILKHINADLQEELNFCREMIESNPKNYQVWHHRRVIVEWVGDSSKELRLTEMIFSHDSKNYHAWEHRQWALRTFKNFEGELEFIEKLLTYDILNNSAWNHRYFVLSRTSGLTLAVLKQEIEFVKKAILKEPNNESPWTYIKGLLQDTSAAEDEISDCWHDLQAWCIELLMETRRVKCSSKTFEESVSNLNKGDVSSHLLIGILDCISYRLERLPSSAEKQQIFSSAVQICEVLSSTHDPIRTRYWQYYSRQLKKKNSQLQSI